MAVKGVLMELFPNPDVYMQLGRFAVVLALGFIVTRLLVVPAIDKLALRNSAGKKTRHQVHNIFMIAGLFLSLILALQAGEFGNIVTVIGTIGAAMTVAVGFGMRDEVGNIVSGVIIHLNSPYVKGDYVSVSEEEGEVQEITLSSTRLNGHSSDSISVPNAKVRGGSIRNYTRGTKTKSSITMNADPEKAEELAEIIRKTAEEHEDALETPAPNILYRKFEEEKLNLEVHYWVRDSSDSKEIKSQILERFTEEAKQKGLLKNDEKEEEEK